MVLKKEKLIVPDTSILISRKLTELIEEGKLKNVKILIPEFVVDELQAQASSGREIGFIGLEEIKELRSKKIKIEIIGRKPTMEEIKLAKKGRIDALIRDIAKEKGAILYTKDMVQAIVAEVFGVRVEYIKDKREEEKKLDFIKYLTDDTLSLHFKTNCIPFAKRGKPGKWKIVNVEDKEFSKKDLERLINSILTEARREEYSFVEFEEYGAIVLQIKDMRIAITRPPFSNSEEITIVRPIVKLTLEDYKLSDKLKKRIKEKAEGILIAGPPGSGKSTFAASLSEFYLKQEKIVKTMEQPRDLQVDKQITQYAPLAKDFGKTSEILLLVRPDYVVFDEIRNTRSFNIFADMRLAGVGMIGVVHASEPIDAIQRFINKVELGMLPNIVDTIIFIKNGKIEKVYSLSMTVRVPYGMTEKDFARPIVEVRTFDKNLLKYEIYSYGEEIVVIPVEDNSDKILSNVKKEILKYDKNPKIDFVSDKYIKIYVDKKSIPKLIGRKGKAIEKLEKKLGVHLDIFEK